MKRRVLKGKGRQTHINKSKKRKLVHYLNNKISKRKYKKRLF